VISANPAARLGRHLRLVPSVATRQEEIKALTREQLSAFLAAAAAKERRWHPLWLARTGLRLGEAIALEWLDLDIAAREIRVTRALSDGEPGTPKLRAAMGGLSTCRRSSRRSSSTSRLSGKRKRCAEAGARCRRWCSAPEVGTPLQVANVRRAFARSLKRAQLPEHFTPHSLRHTFASLLLQQGESPVYVQRQLGHASIKLTVDTYGRWLPTGNKAAVDRLDDRSGSKVVANAVAAGNYRTADAAEVRGNEVVRRGGFEPPTPCLKGRSSTWLS